MDDRFGFNERVILDKGDKILASLVNCWQGKKDNAVSAQYYNATVTCYMGCYTGKELDTSADDADLMLT